VSTPPAPPVIPTSLTITTVVAYLGALALFVVGLLTFAGVVLPANTSSEIQTWSAVAESVAGVVAGLITTLNHHTTVLALLGR
jgi:hypothetical protein